MDQAELCAVISDKLCGFSSDGQDCGGLVEQSCEGLEVTSRIACVGLSLGPPFGGLKKRSL